MRQCVVLVLALGLSFFPACQSQTCDEDDPVVEAVDGSAETLDEPVAIEQSAVPTSLDGEWLIGGRGRFRLHVVVEGETFEATMIGSDVRRSGEVTADGLGNGRFRIEVPLAQSDEGVGPEEVNLFFRNANEGTAFLRGETGLAFIRRVGTMPDELLGSWDIAFTDNYHLAGGVAHFRETDWEVTKGERTARSGPAFFLPSEDGLVHIAAMNNNGYPQLRYTQQTSEGSWLVWEDGNDQHMVLSRPGEWPEWAPPPSDTVESPFIERGITAPGELLGQ